MTGFPGITPAPMEWHPAYRDKPWLLDWLERRGEFARLNDVVLPVLGARPATFAMSSAELDPTEATLRQMTITRHKAHGPAPYVGRPFRYLWPVGVDELGRCIAGEALLVYDEGGPEFSRYLMSTPESEWPTY